MQASDPMRVSTLRKLTLRSWMLLRRGVALSVLLALLASNAVFAEENPPVFWKDSDGQPHFTDSPDSVPEAARKNPADDPELGRKLWEGGVIDESFYEVPEWKTFENEQFKLRFDTRLEKLEPRYIEKAVRYLREARARMIAGFGIAPAKQISVLLYSRDSYRHEHYDRFGFSTLAFYDGKMHVGAPPTAGSELRAILQHEYFHVLFRERTGGDHPLWLNEGLAEIFERNALGRKSFTETEFEELQDAAASDRWIPLARLEKSFAASSDHKAEKGKVRLAYLESTAAALWVDGHTDIQSKRELLEAIAQAREEKRPYDTALAAVLKVDTKEIDQTIRTDLFSKLEAVAPTKIDSNY